MSKSTLFAALIGAVALVGGSGCGEVESCVEGVDRGCLNSRPDDSGNCRFGLVPSADGFTCQKPGGGDAGQAVDPPRDGGGNTNMGNCSCPSGQLCRADNTCFDPCMAASVALKPTPLPCRAPTGTAAYSFEQASQALCTQTCVRRAELCNTTCDPSVECTTTAALLLTATCAGSADCASQLCEQERAKPCAMQQCPGNAQPSCSDVMCSDTCDMPEYNNDGVCDDGDLSNAVSFVCPWGTDCGDCGPRRGSPPRFDLQLGDPCVDPGQCGGNPQQIRGSKGWCVPPDDQGLLYRRCLPDCSTDSSACPAGFECFPLGQDLDGDGEPEPVEDSSGAQAAACFPTQCSK